MRTTYKKTIVIMLKITLQFMSLILQTQTLRGKRKIVGRNPPWRLLLAEGDDVGNATKKDTILAIAQPKTQTNSNKQP